MNGVPPGRIGHRCRDEDECEVKRFGGLGEGKVIQPGKSILSFLFQSEARTAGVVLTARGRSSTSGSRGIGSWWMSLRVAMTSSPNHSPKGRGRVTVGSNGKLLPRFLPAKAFPLAPGLLTFLQRLLDARAEPAGFLDG